MNSYTFALWWACKERPFFAAQQHVVIVENNETSALSRALAKVPDGPFLHADENCCYISSWELRP